MRAKPIAGDVLAQKNHLKSFYCCALSLNRNHQCFQFQNRPCLLVFLLLEIFVTHLGAKSLLMKMCIAGSTLLFLLFSNEKRSKYYSSFWVESIPILWMILSIK